MGTIRAVYKAEAEVSLRRLSLVLLVVALAAAAVYANTLGNGLVYDDRFQIVENSWIRDFRHLPAILTTGVWEFEGGTSNYYRPVMHLVYTVTYAFVGTRPWGYHVVNITLHTLATVLVAALARLLLERGGVPRQDALAGAMLGGLVFAVHPVHTEPVAWVAGVPELAFTVCLLTSLLLHLAGTARDRPKHVLAGAALYFVALMSKETALVLPGLLLATDVSSAPRRPPLITAARRYAPFLLAALAYATLRIAVLPGVAPLRRHAELSSHEVLINIFPLFAKYVRMLVLPFGLNAFHVLHPIPSLASVDGVLSLVVAGLVAVLAVVSMRRRSIVLPALALVVLPLLPVLYIPVLGENTFAERYLYLPSAGLSLLAGLGLARLRPNRRGWYRPLIGVVALLLALGSWMTVERNRVWRDDFSLWTHTVRQSPDSGYVNNEAGIVYAERGRLDDAIRYYKLATRLSPNSARIWNNLGVALAEKGEIERAVEHYRRAIAIDPGFARAHNNLATALARLGASGDAIAHYRQALKLQPGAIETRLNLANLYDAQGQPDAAMAEYVEALRLAPENADVHLHIGIAYGERGELTRAITHLETAARLAPSDPVVRQNLAHAYTLSRRSSDDRVPGRVPDRSNAIAPATRP
jgi:protein O-mannosyl-transferase